MRLWGKDSFKGLGVCMDEAENLANFDLEEVPQVALAMVASGITVPKSGKQEVYPDAKRSLMAQVAPVAWKIEKRQARSMGGGFGLLSHKKCGGAGALGLDDEETERVTKKLATTCGATYLGQVGYAPEPVRVGKSKVMAHMSREPDNHHHVATRFVLTTGYGAGADQLREFENPEIGGHGDAFLCTVDFFAEAIENGLLSMEQIVGYLGLNLDIADKIADGEIHVDSVRFFDSGRLPGRIARLNHDIAEDALAQLKVVTR